MSEKDNINEIKALAEYMNRFMWVNSFTEKTDTRPASKKNSLSLDDILKEFHFKNK